MLEIIKNNPYRILGIYSNSSSRERIANYNKSKAYLKVGKNVDFQLDLSVLLPKINRTESLLSDAESKLTLPADRVTYAQFWFIMKTQADEIAMNHLFVGDFATALQFWENDTPTSLQNRIVCLLIQENYSSALECAEKLYSPSYLHDFIISILGEDNPLDGTNLAYSFLDEICSELSPEHVLPLLKDPAWIHYVSDLVFNDLSQTLRDSLELSATTRGKDPDTRYSSGMRLMTDSKKILPRLKNLSSMDHMRYQVLADKVGIEILQCGIDFYNGTSSIDVAPKAMVLQSYALSVVEGKLAKDRCSENVNILQKAIDNLPPSEVMDEVNAIENAIHSYCQQPDEIIYSMALLDSTKDQLQSIKSKLGSDNKFYLKLSTRVVSNALYNVIAEVNAAQKQPPTADRESVAYILGKHDRMVKLARVLKHALAAFDKMSSFDMEDQFRRDKFDKNLSALSSSAQDLVGYTTPIPTPYIPPQYTNNSSTTSSSSSSTSDSEKNHGCLIMFLLWIALGLIAGGICVANDGDFAAGFCISGVIVLIINGLSK